MKFNQRLLQSSVLEKLSAIESPSATYRVESWGGETLYTEVVSSTIYVARKEFERRVQLSRYKLDSQRANHAWMIIENSVNLGELFTRVSSKRFGLTPSQLRDAGYVLRDLGFIIPLYRSSVNGPSAAKYWEWSVK